MTLEVDRTEEFEPLKNKSGPYSPETVRAAQSERAARWFEQAGFPVERDASGAPRHTYEVSPLTALDPSELREKLKAPPEPKDGKVYV